MAQLRAMCLLWGTLEEILSSQGTQSPPSVYVTFDLRPLPPVQCNSKTNDCLMRTAWITAIARFNDTHSLTDRQRSNTFSTKRELINDSWRQDWLSAPISYGRGLCYAQSIFFYWRKLEWTTFYHRESLTSSGNHALLISSRRKVFIVAA
jgi:hypothetical protein